MTTETPDAELTARLAWFGKARRLHRNKRIIGMAGIILGACLVMWWKFDASVPEWGLWAGLGVIAASWALFAYVIVARWQWVKQNPYRPPA